MWSRFFPVALGILVVFIIMAICIVLGAAFSGA
jgi:hypothetical protein